ncbi:diguanylate cyclase [uncultured Dechloromonas sp.]|uniref:diguanylate cyclase domain-containing protein n=1 Tax=uncultured Dechloromonas sp. TaxID=171719 RepID=UPI0025CC1E28|nr:diguanylate cyclase [uncultured Dechloromonas sp.]
MGQFQVPLREARFGSLVHLGYRGWVATAYLLVALLAGSLLFIEFRGIDEQMNTLARERGAVLFRLVELTRDWNARHGGVYVPITETTQPNPYLAHPQRDLETRDGMRLTMINPAFMTRQIAEIAEQVDGVRFHLTSLKPIRPANAADAWETEALHRFEQGRTEILDLVFEERGPQHRYMAPLMIKQACLTCHAEQGYKLGDIRGGISVTMPAGNILEIRQAQRFRAASVLGGGALCLALLIHFVIWVSRQNFLRLQDISAGQERLIEARTADLSTLNTQLREEVAERKRKEVLISESEARYRSVLETSQDAIVIIEAPCFKIVYANEQTAALLGMELSAVLGEPLPSFVVASERSQVEGNLARRLQGGAVSATSRVRFARPDGSHLRVGDVHVARIDRAARDGQWVVSIKDVTERLADERALQISAAVMESASEGIVVTDAKNHIMQINPAFTAITGYRPCELLGKDPRCLGSGRHDPDFFQSLWQQLGTDGRWEGEVWNRRPDGTLYVVWLSISAICEEGVESGGRHVATFIDITQRKEVEELLRHRAQSDPLTDLPNRSVFYDRLQMALVQARRYGNEFALLYIDLDHFKEVNDSMGHAAGDELLVEAARRMKQVVRDSDTVARLGGDEFAVILPQLRGRDEVEEVARRIVAVLLEPFAVSGGEARVSASVGAAIYPEHGGDMESIRASADAALYAAKDAGRNGYRLATPRES